MIKLLTVLFFLATLANANSDETCYTVQLLSSYDSQGYGGLDNEEYPRDCKVIKLGKANTVRCGCFDQYKYAQKRLDELKGEYPKAFIGMSYKYRFANQNKAVAVKNNVDDFSIDNIKAPRKHRYASVSRPITSRYIGNQTGLSLSEALAIMKSRNLEIVAANLDVKVAKAKEGVASGMNWGKLTFQQDVARSNDAGNVFGFKLTSREANFGDFGAKEFMAGAATGNPDYDTPPDDLNYPKDRNFFQSKLKYEVPLFAGFAISSYTDIMKEVSRLKKLDRDRVVSEKIFQVRKSYYDMALLETSIHNLNIVLRNIGTLENITQSMIDVGYAKHVDLLEVQAKKANVRRLLIQMKANKELLLQYISFLLNKRVRAIKVPTSDVPMPHYTNKEVLSRNLDIQKALTGLRIKRSMQDAAKSKFYPTVGAFGEIATADDTFLGDAEKHKAYTVGARLTWNIFNGGSDSAKLENAKLDRLKMNSQVQLAKEGIALKLAKIRTEIKSMDVEIDSLEKELVLANTIYKNYEYRYKEKLVSMGDVIIKQSLQIEKILQLQKAKTKRTEKVFALEKLANGVR